MIRRRGENDALTSCELAGTNCTAEEVKDVASSEKCTVDDRIRRVYGDTNIRLSRRHEGSRVRLARVLEKARKGEKIKVAVLGGSGEC